MQLLGERLRRLAAADGRPAVRTWVAQGTGDEICPEVFAQQLVAGLASAGVPHTAYFYVDSNSKLERIFLTSNCFCNFL